MHVQIVGKECHPLLRPFFRFGIFLVGGGEMHRIPYLTAQLEYALTARKQVYAVEPCLEHRLLIGDDSLGKYHARHVGQLRDGGDVHIGHYGEHARQSPLAYPEQYPPFPS